MPVDDLPPFELRINVNEGVHYQCADCGSPNILIKIDQPDFQNMCNHAHPMGPPGRVVFSHPLDEPCALRESLKAREEGRCYQPKDHPDDTYCSTHDCSASYQCGKQSCPHCVVKFGEDESGPEGC